MNSFDSAARRTPARSGTQRSKGWRRLHHLLAAIVVLGLLSTVPAAADSHDSTVIVAIENTSTFAVSGSKTDGEYVAWTGGSTSIHDRCSSVNVARLDTREQVASVRIGDGSAYALQGGYLVVETPATQCRLDSPDMADAGIFVVDLATGEQQEVWDDADDVVAVAIDYPSVAWAVREEIDGVTHQTIWEKAATSTGSPAEVDRDEVQAGGGLYLFIEDGAITWVTTYGSDGVGSAARGWPMQQTTWFMSMHDTTEVALAGDTMVTLTEGRPLYHNLEDGTTRWLGDVGARNLATDGRYVFWTSSEGKPAITGYDLLTDARFKVWEVPSAEPGFNEQILDISAAGGALAWTHYAYNEYMTAIHAAPVHGRLPSARQTDPGTTSPDWTFYAETGHYLANDFRDFWDGNGGLPVFGYPLTEEFDYVNHDEGMAYAAQMTERQRFEWHPENIGTPYAVLLGRLGQTILEQQGRDWNLFEKADPGAEHYFAETGHAIAPEFWGYWSSHGLDMGDPGVSYAESLALFGFPLSEPMLETNPDGDTVLTQYFERAVFEYHPANPPEHQVLLRRLGAELLTAWNW